jgi:hypothetical protein
MHIAIQRLLSLSGDCQCFFVAFLQCSIPFYLLYSLLVFVLLFRHGFLFRYFIGLFCALSVGALCIADVLPFWQKLHRPVLGVSDPVKNTPAMFPGILWDHAPGLRTTPL